MRLLVIDDERELAHSLGHGLRAQGYAVDVAYDGLAGYELGVRHPYAAIILDLMLPGRNGYRVCTQLRAAGVSSPILVLTAKDGEYDQTEALDTGADDYLSKPFSYPVLLARLRALIRRGGSSRSTVIRTGDLTLDLSARRCWRGPTEVTLTSKQFAVLACLARRAGQVVSKVDIVDEVWDASYDGDLNIVEVYVRALRQRIDRPFATETIETVRGCGYRLVGLGT